jgi:signal transduction histidine kinase
VGTLLANAVRHAFAPGQPGVIHLRVAVDAAGQLNLLCRDDGVGMSAEIISHIFEPFFTTQRANGRLGLGLYMCYNIVNSKLGGSIHCTSSPGQGSTFEVVVPITQLEVNA